MASQKHDLTSVALAQLETAIRLYFDAHDFLAAITLAGAADEIFGKRLAARGCKNSLDTITDAVSAIHMHLFATRIESKTIIKRANRARNALKHGQEGEEYIRMDAEEEARDMLNRAIDNYWALEQKLSPGMDRFYREYIERVAATPEEEDAQ